MKFSTQFLFLCAFGATLSHFPALGSEAKGHAGSGHDKSSSSSHVGSVDAHAEAKVGVGNNNPGHSGHEQLTGSVQVLASVKESDKSLDHHGQADSKSSNDHAHNKHEGSASSVSLAQQQNDIHTAVEVQAAAQQQQIQADILRKGQVVEGASVGQVTGLGQHEPGNVQAESHAQVGAGNGIQAQAQVSPVQNQLVSDGGQANSQVVQVGGQPNGQIQADALAQVQAQPHGNLGQQNQGFQVNVPVQGNLGQQNQDFHVSVPVQGNQGLQAQAQAQIQNVHQNVPVVNNVPLHLLHGDHRGQGFHHGAHVQNHPNWGYNGQGQAHLRNQGDVRFQGPVHHGNLGNPGQGFHTGAHGQASAGYSGQGGLQYGPHPNLGYRENVGAQGQAYLGHQGHPGYQISAQTHSVPNVGYSGPGHHVHAQGNVGYQGPVHQGNLGPHGQVYYAGAQGQPGYNGQGIHGQNYPIYPRPQYNGQIPHNGNPGYGPQLQGGVHSQANVGYRGRLGFNGPVPVQQSHYGAQAQANAGYPDHRIPYGGQLSNGNLGYNHGPVFQGGPQSYPANARYGVNQGYYGGAQAQVHPQAALGHPGPQYGPQGVPNAGYRSQGPQYINAGYPVRYGGPNIQAGAQGYRGPAFHGGGAQAYSQGNVGYGNQRFQPVPLNNYRGQGFKAGAQGQAYAGNGGFQGGALSQANGNIGVGRNYPLNYPPQNHPPIYQQNYAQSVHYPPISGYPHQVPQVPPQQVYRGYPQHPNVYPANQYG